MVAVFAPHKEPVTLQITCIVLSLYDYLQHEYNNTEEAIEQVREGKAWAAIGVPENYTKDICERAFDSAGGQVTPEIINGSTVHLYMDVTSMEFQIRLCYFTLHVLLCS